jgi:hypothetical protein
MEGSLFREDGQGVKLIAQRHLVAKPTMFALPYAPLRSGGTFNFRYRVIFFFLVNLLFWERNLPVARTSR